MISEDTRAFARTLGSQGCQRKETNVHGLRVKTVQKQLLHIQERRYTHLKKGARNHCGDDRCNRDRDRAMAKKLKKEQLKKQRRKEKKQMTKSK